MRFWLKNVLIALDQLVNAICGGFADETLSALSYRLHRNGISHWRMYLIDTLFFFDRKKDPDTGRVIRHCEGSYLSELYGRQLPPEYR